MKARAEAAEQTRLDILASTAEFAVVKRLVDISLGEVATAAGVSVQTVLRKFGSRAGLIEAAIGRVALEVDKERPVPVGDTAAALEVVVDEYERRGDSLILLLAQENYDPQVHRITERDRRMHRTWVETVFAPCLPSSAEARDELVDLLEIATDILTWRQLRRCRALDRPTATRRMRTLISALLESSPGSRS